jgi:spore coat protein CotH
MRTRTIALLAAVCSIVPLLPGVVSAQTAEELFDPSALHEIRLFINSRDLQQLRRNFELNTYYTADLLWRGVRVRNVAVRSRGAGSRNGTKLGLLVDIDRYSSRQRFLGLTSLVLDNLWQDPSFLREQLAMATFRRMGQPAPRTSFARLFINNQYEGLYAITEAIDDAFLERSFGERGGYSFEYHWIRRFYGEALGDDLAAYKPLFEPQNHTLEADATLYGPLRSLLNEVNAPVDSVWRERVAMWLDLEQFVTQAAIETFLSELDGLLGYEGINNFYLYRSAGTSPHRVIPWDRDNAFQSIDSSIFLRTDENIILRNAFAFDDLRALYLDVLEASARAALEEEWLWTQIERLLPVIEAAAIEDPRKQFSNELFAAQVEFLRAFARERPAFVLREVSRAR